MLVRIGRFRGTAPGIPEHLLADAQAAEARDADTSAGTLRPFRLPRLAQPLGRTGMRSLVPHEGLRLTWPYRVRTAPPPDPDSGRLFWTLEGGPGTPPDRLPRWTDPAGMTRGGPPYPAETQLLGLAAPGPGGGARAEGAPIDGAFAAPELRWYLTTFVAGAGEESAPGPLIGPVTVEAGQSVLLSGLPPAPAGRRITARRLYRSSAGSGGAAFRFVADLDPAATGHGDALPADALGEVLPSADWQPPPAGCYGLAALPGGVLAAAEGRSVWFSEPRQPHAWPPLYRLTLADRIVGLAAVGSHLVACTTGAPVLIGGSDPASMAAQSLELDEPCVSAAGILPVPGGVLYPSRRGLVLAGPGGAQLVTAGWLDEAAWARHAPHTLEAAALGRRYVGLHAGPGLVLVDIAAGELMALSAPGAEALAGHEGGLWWAAGDRLVQWNGGPGLQPYRWRSRPFRRDLPGSFAVARVEGAFAADRRLTLSLIADGSPDASLAVTSDRPFRLPARRRARSWSVVLEGTVEVRELALADSIEELQRP